MARNILQRVSSGWTYLRLGHNRGCRQLSHYRSLGAYTQAKNVGQVSTYPCK